MAQVNSTLALLRDKSLVHTDQNRRKRRLIFHRPTQKQVRIYADMQVVLEGGWYPFYSYQLQWSYKSLHMIQVAASNCRWSSCNLCSSCTGPVRFILNPNQWWPTPTVHFIAIAPLCYIYFRLKKQKCQVHPAKANSCMEPCDPCAAAVRTSWGPSWDLQQVAAVASSCHLKNTIQQATTSWQTSTKFGMSSVFLVKFVAGMATEEELCKVWWYMAAWMFLFSSVYSKEV